MSSWLSRCAHSIAGLACLSVLGNLLLAAVAASMCGCSKATQEKSLFEEGKQYSLLISADLDDDLTQLEDDSVVRIGGGDIGGETVVYVNDSPVDVYSFGGQVFAIDDFLAPGEIATRNCPMMRRLAQRSERSCSLCCVR